VWRVEWTLDVCQTTVRPDAGPVMRIG
jgi:hypothetical protein